MRPTKDRGFTVEGNLSGEDVHMKIDEASFEHIMSILTDLYSDPEYAVLREYTTNAYDSHVEAGVKRPIEVFLPTNLSPFLRVRDYGIGLTVDDIHRIYSQYGASTKRGTDEQTGMLGLGCKSALTYAAQFTVEARRDGEAVVVVVSRTDTGGGVMKIVDRRATDEPNGVEVTVPTRQNNAFKDKAERLFQFWPPNTVLVNDQAPKTFKGLAITKHLHLLVDSKNSYSYTRDLDRHICVMGNVPYPMQLPDEFEQRIPVRTSLVAFMPIGTVNFTPSREALHYTTHTKKALAALHRTYETEVPVAVQRAVTAAPSHAEALAVVSEWAHLLPNKSTVFHYRGDELPLVYEDFYPLTSTTVAPTPRPLRVTPNKGFGRLSGHTLTTSWDARLWPRTVWVENFEPSDCSSDHKRKLQKWAADSNVGDVDSFVLLHDKLRPSAFIPAGRVVDYKTVIRPMRLSAPASGASYGSSKIPGSYWTWTESTSHDYHGTERAGRDIRQQHPIIYERGNKYSGRTYARKLALIYLNFTLICMPSNRIAKFKRLVPKAMTYDEALGAKARAWAAKLTDDQKLALMIHRQGAQTNLQQFDSMNLHDPDLTAAIRLSKLNGLDKLVQQSVLFALNELPLPKWSNPLRRYPLVERGTWGAPQAHIETYMNAIYKHSQEAQ